MTIDVVDGIEFDHERAGPGPRLLSLNGSGASGFTAATESTPNRIHVGPAARSTINIPIMLPANSVRLA